MHIGHNIVHGDYNTSNQQLPTTDKQQDLGNTSIQLIEVIKYLNGFTSASARGLFDYALKWQNKKEWSKTYCKTFQYISCHISYYKIITTWNTRSYEVASSRTVNSLKNCLDTHRAEHPQCPSLTGSNHRCRTYCNSRVHKQSNRTEFCWKWTHWPVLLLLLLLQLIIIIILIIT